jgi:hypothetical protein
MGSEIWYILRQIVNENVPSAEAVARPLPLDIDGGKNVKNLYESCFVSGWDLFVGELECYVVPNLFHNPKKITSSKSNVKSYFVISFKDWFKFA